MTMLRFDYQRIQTRAALGAGPGLVLNVGANEDPGRLKEVDPARVFNCDLFPWDDVMNRPNRVDVLFDCVRDRWPFDDDAAELVVMGDILEHLAPDEILVALREARRVARRICVTVPSDNRPETFEKRDHLPRGAVHVNYITAPELIGYFIDAGWRIRDWQQVDYGFVPIGFFVTAERAAPAPGASD